MLAVNYLVVGLISYEEGMTITMLMKSSTVAMSYGLDLTSSSSHTLKREERVKTGLFLDGILIL